FSLATTVRQQPFTATLSPSDTSSGSSFGQSITRRMPSPRCAVAIILPTASTMPENIALLRFRFDPRDDAQVFADAIDGLHAERDAVVQPRAARRPTHCAL